MQKILVLAVFLVSGFVKAESDPCESTHYPVKWESELESGKPDTHPKFCTFRS